MKTYYSASQNTFYLDSDIQAGIYISLPDDLLEVDDAIVDEFSVFTNGEQVRVAGPDGYPVWGDRPALDSDGIQIKKDILISAANKYVTDRQWPGKASLGRLTDEEKQKYIKWLDYIDALFAIDPTSKKVVFPVSPE